MPSVVVRRISRSLFLQQTLAECTAKMDPDTWNAYHIVSNRARAVCYATRQLQFKRQTEHTVNALVSTAVGQLEAMEKLKVQKPVAASAAACELPICWGRFAWWLQNCSF